MGGGERVWAHLFCERAVPTPETGVGCRSGGTGGFLKGHRLPKRRGCAFDRAPVGFERVPVVKRAQLRF
jgi:hypothetical protein